MTKLDLTMRYVNETGEKINTKNDLKKVRKRFPKEWAIIDEEEKYKKSLWDMLPNSFRRNRGINEYTVKELEEKIKLWD